MSHALDRRPLGGASLLTLIVALVAAFGTAPLEAQGLATPVAPISSSGLDSAGYEDYRTPVGRMEGGELRIRLEAREAAWYPWGDDGPPILAHVFAADGGAPRVPAPLIRVPAGTPVRVTLRNTFDRDLVVRGLRRGSALSPSAGAGPPPSAGAGPPPRPDSVVVAPGAEMEVRFTPAFPGTYIYTGSVGHRPGAGGGPGAAGDAQGTAGGNGGAGPAAAERRPDTPGPHPAATEILGRGEGNRAWFGVLIVDPPGEPRSDERVFLITHWGDPNVPGSFLPATRFFINGRSWPHTERLEYAQGDTVRWRILNMSGREHPMHLHGFYFRVDARGDQNGDRLIPPNQRRLAVTEALLPAQTMRISWVPEEPGNWIFHCHFMRHMSWMQTAPVGDDIPSHYHGSGHGENLMGGLVLGITVRPAPDHSPASDVARRRLNLHIGKQPAVFDDEPGYGFVLQQGDVAPPADSVHFPGSAIVLNRGEPTEIVVHNRADVPLGVHWHGIELESWADGVPDWSGMPGRVVPAIAPGDSLAVRLTPPRAGTFMYHVHSEPGHQLAQGLYGAFLVLDPGAEWDRETDRLFLLGSLGAGEDAPPALNGSLEPQALTMDAGASYRLRFMHISPDDDKRVTLVGPGGETVAWHAVAKDGADLPGHQVRELPAELRIHVGETYDFLWTPQAPGHYVLRIVTTFDTGATAFPRDAPPPHTMEVPVLVR